MAIILHVDDYAPYLRLVRFVLENSGHVVVTACNGQQALDYLANANIDLLIADIVMPIMDGLMLTRELRRDLRYKHLPIMFLTARSVDQKDESMSGLDADVVLSKPIDSDEILAEIDRLMARARDKAALDRVPSLEKSAA